ncbi:MAG: hypothetical protein DAHOPDDO_02469 [Ignavibacteriaceae bacterium]|nr:hypothetical protein [Ignavibacteriaceae bacterium]
MPAKEVLQVLIQNFSTENLIQLFRNKSNKFRLINENENQYNNEFFSNVLRFGEIKLNNDEELIIYTFNTTKELTERSGKKAQYVLAKKILKQEHRYSAGFFIFYDTNNNFRLSLVYDTPLPNGKREWSNFKRFTYYVSTDQTNKTFINQIDGAQFTSLAKISEAFSVEKVTKEFYSEIANWYFWALKEVKFPDDAEDEKNGKENSVIRLITRLIFIWFMKVRKLVPEELFNENALKEILTDLKLNNDNYYKAVLQNLFFATLNTKQDVRRFTSKKKGFKGYSKDFGNHNVYRYEDFFKDSEEVIEKYFMPIPFLNGGLFECLDYKKTKPSEQRKYIDGFTETKAQQPSVPNFLFFSDDKIIDLNKDYGTTNKKYNVRGLINTLSLYNFTIDESDPNDADVALDPELLGKVFENLLASYNPETAKTARKSTGSYYTPRPIVDYMVDESLKQYFKAHFETENLNNKLNILFSSEDHLNPFEAQLTKELVNIIDSLRVVDPAVGSGAFPMRILNRLVFLLHKLDPDNSLWKQSQIDGIKKSVKDPTLQRKFIEDTERRFKEKNPDYGRKLYLIEKCIYGVDIQQIAVEIAKLRFFISLLVDEKVENGEIEPLPNLDFKLMQGNSLISSFAGIDFTTKPQNDDSFFDFDERYKHLIEEFEELKSQYQNEPDVQKKREHRDDIDAKLIEIFSEKLKQHYPKLNNLEGKYGGREEIIEAEKKKLFKKIGIDLDQAEQDLIAYTEGRKQKDFFLWDVYFAEVFAEKGGFDIVIGNPPYFNVSTFNNLKNSEYFKDIVKGVVNSASLFLNFGLDISQNTVSFIIPKSFTTVLSWKPIRSKLLRESSIKIISNQSKAFEVVGLEQIIIIYCKGNKKNNIVKLLDGFDLVSEIRQEYFQEIEKILITANAKQYAVIKKIESDKISLEEIADMPRGLTISNKNLSSQKLSNYIQILGGTNVERFLIKDGNKRKPNRFILQKNKILLRYQKIFNQERILYQNIASSVPKIVAAYCNASHPTDDTLNNLIIKEAEKYDYKFILGILNSKLSTFYLRFAIIDNSILTVHLDKPYLGQICLPKLSIAHQNNIIKSVARILSAKNQNPKADTKHLEDQIDIMVYKLYNLTYEEVKIIDPEIEKIISENEYEKFEKVS